MFTKPRLNLRFLALSLAFSLAVATGALGLNALVKAQHEQDRINEKLPEEPCRIFTLVPCTKVDINVNDITVPSLIVGLAAGLVGVLSSIFMTMPMFSQRYAKNPRVYIYESISLALLSLLSLGSLIPMTVYFAVREAKVNVWVGNHQVQPVIVAQMIDFLGETTQYNQIGYLKPYIIVPWIGWYFSAFAAGCIFIDGRNGRWATMSNFSGSADEMRETDTQNLRPAYSDPAPSFLGRP
ncbi:hypothetical protein BDZ89DRAFT_1158200 [Hymenopellis radicata]|nr:hypothetical protein BDZ89DRAFT_1159681 [Hymenopellis radicata]KAF9033769.1 hypothetical protein BDZ89DRAFT_1158200 [Hymenopellis radicata]